MTRTEKEFGDRSNDDIIREILRACASRENPIGRENDKVYNNGQRCGEFIDKKEDEFTEILLFWKSQGWYERTKIDRMLDDFEKFYAEIKEI